MEMDSKINLCTTNNYVLGDNLLFCGYWVTMSNYDETYGVIYEVIYDVIMRNFRASMEPFCDSKFSEYVE